MKNRKSWRRKRCEGCKKKFWVRLCYLRRRWNAGRFCSIPCRSKKPRLSELSKKIGKKVARQYRQKELFQKTRINALRRLVLQLGSKARKFFNVKCKVCNQLEYVERCFGVRKHSVIWRG